MSIIPYGVSDYKTIVNDKSVYVDKTPYIEKLELIGRYNIFLRPRRFGKSLMTSVLHYYYDVRYKDEFDYLFGNTYIGKHKTAEANSYHVLKFIFTVIDSGVESSRRGFYEEVKSSIALFIRLYKLEVFPDYDIKESGELLRDFMKKYMSVTDMPIYILIDEYDHFANTILSENKSLFKEITAAGGFVRSFYEVFKDYSGTVIKRLYITGVTPITLDSLTSGFNSAANISNELIFNEMVGFNENEVLSLLDQLDIPQEEHIRTLRKYYNGYMFNETAKNTMYNSNMILNYLKSMVINGEPPRNLVDTSISSDLQKITGLFNIYENEEEKKEVLETIVAKKELTSGFKTRFERDIITNKADFVSMIYYLGFLTMTGDSFGEIIFTTPNYTVEDTYFKYYLNYLSEQNNIRIDASEISAFIRDLIQYHKYDKLKAYLSKHLRLLSNRDYVNFSEKHVKMLLFASLRLSSYYTVKSELEVENGYIDLALLPNFINQVDNYYIIELKYIKKEQHENDPHIFEAKRQEAIGQLNKYATSEELSNTPNLRKVAIIAVKDEVFVEELA